MTTRILLAIIAGGVLFGVAFVTAKAYTMGFKLSSHPTNSILVAALLFPMVYIAGLIGGRSVQLMGHIPYTILNVIAGVFFYLFLGAIILGVTLIAGALFHFSVPLWFVWTIFIASFIVALLGLYQAQTPVITRYTVTLKDAPASWNGKTAILISDTHFGLVNHKRFSDKLVSAILAAHPDFVLHAGDFYDGPKIDTAPITESWKRLTAQTPVFYTPGNHEEYGDYNMFVNSVRDAGATVLDNKKIIFDGVTIAGITYHAGVESAEAAEALQALALDPNAPTILINHPPTAKDAASEHGIDLMVSGHTHNGQLWPLNYIAKRVYGDYVYGLHAYNGMQVLTSRGAGTFGPPFRTFNQSELMLITFKTQ